MSWLPIRLIPENVRTSLRKLRTPKKRRRSDVSTVQLGFEILERRELPATVQFSSGTFSVNEDAGTATITVNLDTSTSGNVTVQYATSDGTAAAGSDYTTASGTATIFQGQTSTTFTVKITDDDVSESGETITLTLSSPTNATLGSPSSATLTVTNVTSTKWVTTGQERLTDPVQGTLLPFGIELFDPQRGASVLYHALDTRRSDSGLHDSWNSVGTPAAMVYYSDTVNVKPFVEATFGTQSADPVPTSVQYTLTWNGGSAQSARTFTTSGTAGDSFVMADQVSSAVSSTGRYTWQIQVKATFSARGDVLRTVSGTTSIIVNGSSSAFGYGWSLAGLDKLVSDGSGVLWVHGAGGTRYFTGASGTLTSPANDFGTLVKNGDNTYTYTAKNQVKWHFGTSGTLTKIVDPHDLTRTFTYSGGNLAKIEEPDGGVTTFTYSGGLLSKIEEPGARTVTFTYTGSDLTKITNPDGGVRTLAYDANHKVTNDQLGPHNTTFTYDGTNGSLTKMDRGSGATLTVTAQAVQPLTLNPAKTTANSQAGLIDGLGHRTTYTLDGLGRTTVIKDSDQGLGTQTFTYDAAGLLTSYKDALNRTTTYTYTGSDLTQIDHADSSLFSPSIATFAYDSTYHTPTLYQDTRGNRTTFTYNAANGDLLTVKDALGNLTTFTWTSGLLESVKDPLNHVTTFSWDTSARRLSAIIDALNQRTTFTYDSKGSAATLKDALGRVTTTAYDALRRLTSLTDPTGGQATFTYNAVGDVTSNTNPRGYRTDYTYYDGTGLLKTMLEAAGTGVARTTTWAYDAVDRLTSFSDPLGHRTTYTYSASLPTVERTNPVGAVETYIYDAAMQLTNYLDGRNNSTSFAYHNRGWRTTTSTPVSSTENVYDTEGNLTAFVDGRSNRTTFAYDALNRVESVKDALGNVTTFVYDNGGNLQAVHDARGNRTTFTYDAIDRRTEVKDALGRITTFAYDAVGNITERIDALTHRTTFTYDSLNLLITQKLPSTGVTTFAYDANSNRTNVIDALGNKTTYVYDALDRMTETIDALAGKTTFVYDAADNLVNLIDPVGNKTTFIYDNADRLTTETDPLGKSMTYAYDAANNVTSRTDRAARRRDFTYDNGNRLETEKWITSGVTENTLTFTYDANHNLLTARDSDGRITFTYDAVNRRDTQKDVWSLTLTFTYDAVGNRTKVQDSLSGVTTSTYNAVNLLTKREFGGSGLTPLRFDLTYTTRNELETVTRYSDLAGSTKIGSTTYVYDTTGRLSNLQHRNGGGSLLANFTYTYDAGNRLTTDVTNGTTKTFTYDNTNQLTNDGSVAYSYDANGNRTMTGYTTGSGNRMTNDGVYTYTYDDEGNLVRKSKGTSAETWEYRYDHWNHMFLAEKRATVGGTLQMLATYVYDALGNRIEKQVDADGAGGGGVVTTRFAVDMASPGGLPEVWADLDGSSALTMRYVRGDEVDQLFARISAAGTAAWYLTDRMGSTRNMVDAGGTLTNTVTYDGFGNVLTETGSGDRWKWTGRETDSETGLQYNRARYYDPRVGRWTSEDIVRFAAGDASLFRYVGNAPTFFHDPSGLLAGSVANSAGQGPQKDPKEEKRKELAKLKKDVSDAGVWVKDARTWHNDLVEDYNRYVDVYNATLELNFWERIAINFYDDVPKERQKYKKRMKELSNDIKGARDRYDKVLEFKKYAEEDLKKLEEELGKP